MTRDEIDTLRGEIETAQGTLEDHYAEVCRKVVHGANESNSFLLCTAGLSLYAAKQGLGLAYTAMSYATNHCESEERDELQSALDDWEYIDCPSCGGDAIYDCIASLVWDFEDKLEEIKQALRDAVEEHEGEYIGMSDRELVEAHSEEWAAVVARLRQEHKERAEAKAKAERERVEAEAGL